MKERNVIHNTTYDWQ